MATGLNKAAANKARNAVTNPAPKPLNPAFPYRRLPFPAGFFGVVKDIKE